MIVPFAKGQQAAPPQAKPSETAMLMAIAQMHQAGAFKTAMNTEGMRRSTNVEDVRQGSPAKNYRNLQGPGEQMEDLYKGGDEPEGVMRKGG